MSFSKCRSSACLAAAVAAALSLPVLAQDKSPSQSASAPKASADSKSTSHKGSEEITVLTPVLVMMPTTVAVDNATKNGCWVKLYDKNNYQGDNFTLAGPIDLPQLTGPFGFNWENRVHSMKVGPKTNVTIYDNRNFRDQDKQVTSGTDIPELSKKMGFFDDFRSMKMSCS